MDQISIQEPEKLTEESKSAIVYTSEFVAPASSVIAELKGGHPVDVSSTSPRLEALNEENLIDIEGLQLTSAGVSLSEPSSIPTVEPNMVHSSEFGPPAPILSLSDPPKCEDENIGFDLFGDFSEPSPKPVVQLTEQTEEVKVDPVSALPEVSVTGDVEEDNEPPPPPAVLFREPSSSDPEAPESTHTYFQQLGSLRLQMSDWNESNTGTYIYSDSALGEEGLNRLNKEIKALSRSLPCEPSGAVFLHMDSSNLSRLKVLISGTEDTPYEHGLYLFDIKLNSDYPNSPPEMTIKTTGGGILRFNPNLYNSGYVCLSVINTWGGDPEEMWNSSYSTLMQVFLSIQALVMNNDVIQKEPGYEHLEANSPVNIDYCGVVRYGNICYAMIDMIQNPPEEFREIVMKHFAIKKEKIIEKVQQWVNISENIGNGFSDHLLQSHNSPTINLMKEKGAKSLFEAKFEELKVVLANLPSL